MKLAWIYGPPGVGKSTAAWQLYTDLVLDGVACAYVDIDQLGMCCPPRMHDPGRHRLKVLALAAVVPNYLAAGVEILVVSGVIDPTLVDWCAGRLAAAELTFCLLVLDEDQLRRRHEERGASAQEWDLVLREVHKLDDARLMHATVDTTGVLPQDVADAVRARLGTRVAATSILGSGIDAGGGMATPCSAPGRVIWVCGPTAVGKSTVSWAVYSALLRDAITTGYLDLRQLGFVGDPAAGTRHVLQAANIASMWGCFRAAGATHLILSGAADTSSESDLYRAALPATQLTIYRLRVDRTELVRRFPGTWSGPGTAPGRRSAHRPASRPARQSRNPSLDGARAPRRRAPGRCRRRHDLRDARRGCGRGPETASVTRRSEERCRARAVRWTGEWSRRRRAVTMCCSRAGGAAATTGEPWSADALSRLRTSDGLLRWRYRPPMVDNGSDDGSRATVVADQIQLALVGAASARGVEVAGRPGRWVDTSWHGRRLLVVDSPFAGDAPGSGSRGIAIGLSTRPRGRWRSAPAVRGSSVLGAALPLSPLTPGPDGTWADDPGLAAEVWWFAERLLPAGTVHDQAGVDAVVQLHARPDSVVWHLRADAAHPHVLVEALDLLEQVAAYGESDEARWVDDPEVQRPSGPTLRVLVTRVLAGLVILAMILLAAAPLLR